MLFEQVSDPATATQLMFSQKFSDDVNINTAVKSGDWKILFDDIGSIYSVNIINTTDNHYSL